MRVVTPPEFISLDKYQYENSIFLGGSIEMGTARDWQKEFIVGMKLKHKFNRFTIFNPRRDDFDPKWNNDLSNPNMYQQIMWEQTYLKLCKRKIFFFAKNTVSAITLQELAEYGDKRSLVVIEDGYLKRANLELYCIRHRIAKLNSIEHLLQVVV